MGLRFYVVGRERRRNESAAKPPRVERRVNTAVAEHYIGLPDRRVSRRHAEVYVLEGRILVLDLGSRNGTFVLQDGRIQRVTEAYVRPNQIVSFGGYLVRMASLLRSHDHDCPNEASIEDEEAPEEAANPRPDSGTRPNLRE